MKRIKLKIIVLSIAAILMTLFVPQTLAYYTSSGVATNVITSGNIQLMIHETTDQGTAFPEEGVYIVPGDVVSKEVRIENICQHPFYLRVKLVYDIDAKELPAEDCFKLNINEENWELHDGWYYYRYVVEPGEKTPYVFSHVEIVGSKVDNRYLGKTLSLSVLAQAVQSENNPLEDGKTYTASGWPSEQGGAA